MMDLLFREDPGGETWKMFEAGDREAVEYLIQGAVSYVMVIDTSLKYNIGQE
jgi:hypothetical protein